MLDPLTMTFIVRKKSKIIIGKPQMNVNLNLETGPNVLNHMEPGEPTKLGKKPKLVPADQT